jgi:hypothetical protein
MLAWIRIGLLAIALAAWAAGGASLALLRNRWLQEGRTDFGMLSVTGALLAVGSLCTAAASGLVGILAFGGISVWSAYTATAQRLGVFRIESTSCEEPEVEEPRRRI